MRAPGTGNKRHARRAAGERPALAVPGPPATLAAGTPPARRGVNDSERSGPERRESWARQRAEQERRLAEPSGPSRSDRLWWVVREGLRRVRWRALLGGVYRRGMANALDIRLNRMAFAFPDLPEAFDGYTILHLTDMHFDRLEGTAGRLIALLDGVRADLCAMTGDYGVWWKEDLEHVLGPMRRVVATVEAADGFLATLGNHDSMRLVAPLEALGIRVLVNETLTIARGDEKIHVTGLDDVHRFRGEAASAALRAAPTGFRLLLVHSPEIVEEAAEAGHSFYLTGHTHGGQVSLPGGIPILTNSRGKRAHARGAWRHGAMQGYTSPGAGVSLVPIRFNTRGEVTLITLKRRQTGDLAPEGSLR